MQHEGREGPEVVEGRNPEVTILGYERRSPLARADPIRRLLTNQFT